MKENDEIFFKVGIQNSWWCQHWFIFSYENYNNSKSYQTLHSVSSFWCQQGNGFAAYILLTTYNPHTSQVSLKLFNRFLWSCQFRRWSEQKIPNNTTKVLHARFPM